MMKLLLILILSSILISGCSHTPTNIENTTAIQEKIEYINGLNESSRIKCIMTQEALNTSREDTIKICNLGDIQ
jgi:hypothetical protein